MTPRPPAPAEERPRPPRSTAAARTPFVLLVVALLSTGMLGLLFLNASLNEGSFELGELRRETQELTDEEQELQAEVDAHAAPDALAERARELGLVPGGPPAFLSPDGSILGDPSPAPSPPPEESGQGSEGEDEDDSGVGTAGATPSDTDSDTGTGSAPDADTDVGPDTDTDTDADTGSASPDADADAEPGGTP
ncbi:FtsB family cell division protein [Streptomyces sp. 4N509B]|uniref:FtsB family cell division protein n=1 Tax=Streptomyces sp. 4N509B TaxID=3457413 RepID=UPI003FD50F0A